MAHSHKEISNATVLISTKLRHNIAAICLIKMPQNLNHPSICGECSCLVDCGSWSMSSCRNGRCRWLLERLRWMRY